VGPFQQHRLTRTLTGLPGIFHHTGPPAKAISAVLGVSPFRSRSNSHSPAYAPAQGRSIERTAAAVFTQPYDRAREFAPPAQIPYARSVPIHLAARQLAAFRRELLKWFRAHRRALPWRVLPQGAPAEPGPEQGRGPSPHFAAAKRDGNSYRIWLSEVMLQQTRISAVIPYYERFTSKFPTAQALASAREHEVLRYWAGLGYYSRARNLHRAAREIVERHGGQFPRTHPEALALPGVGTYMAAAVLSMAYDAQHAVVDGNVARVLARLGAVRGDLRVPRTWKRLSTDAQTLLATESPGDWNEAMMELGETICTPRTPRCEACPVARFCSARQRGLQNKIPAARRKREPVIVTIAAAVLLDPRRRTTLVKDPGAHDAVLFSRMWQFPAAEITGSDPEAELRSHLAATPGIRVESLTRLPAARHAVTFRNITLLPFLAPVPELPEGPRIRAIPLEKLSEIPVSSATRKIAAAVLRTFSGGRRKRAEATAATATGEAL